MCHPNSQFLALESSTPPKNLSPDLHLWPALCIAPLRPTFMLVCFFVHPYLIHQHIIDVSHCPFTLHHFTVSSVTKLFMLSHRLIRNTRWERPFHHVTSDATLVKISCRVVNSPMSVGSSPSMLQTGYLVGVVHHTIRHTNVTLLCIIIISWHDWTVGFAWI